MKFYYSIKEAASQVGETESTLRFWEKEFSEEIKPDRNKRGVRFYQEKDIEDIKRIQHFIRDCGLTLDGVRKRLDGNNRESSVRQAKAVLRLKNIKAELIALKKAMDEVKSPH